MEKIKKYKKIILDVVMLVIYILVMNYTFTGVLWHEILSLVISLAFIIHLVFNYKWIINITKNFRKVNNKTKLLYIIDAIIFILFIICIFSGVYISRVLFYFSDGNVFFTKIHSITAYLAMFFTIIHILLHFSFFVNSFEKMFNLKNKIITKIVTGIVLFVFSIFSSYEFIQSSLNKESKKETDLDLNIEEDVIKEDIIKEDENIQSDEKVIEEEKVQDETDDSPVTLEEYLEDKVCDGCRKRCSLLFPLCSIGEKQATEATEEYNEIYGP